MTSTTAPILRQRLQLALLNRHQKQTSLLQKGFTLVELMIVIVIVGILSAVALPNFLNQTSKAKGTECTTKATGILKQVAAEALIDQADANTLGTSLSATETTNSNFCTFTYTAIASDIAKIDAVGKGDLSGKYDANGCVNVATAKQDMVIATANANAAAAAAVCS